MKLRLRPRMVAGFLLMSALLIVVGIFTSYYTNRMQANTSRILVENVSSLKSAEELEIALLDMKGLTANYLLDGQQNWLDVFSEKKSSFDHWFNQARERTHTDEEKTILDEIEISFTDYLKYQNKVIQFYERGNFNKAHQLLTREMRLTFDKIYDKCEDLIFINEKIISNISHHIDRDNRTINRIMFGIGILGILLGLALGMILARGITHSIYELVLKVRGATNEEIVEKVDIANETELEHLSKHVRRLIDKVHEVNRDLERSQKMLIRSEKLASLGRMSAGLAHELRNPLTAIKMLIFTVQKEAPKDAQLAKDFGVILKEIERMETFLQNFLDFARPPEPNFSAIDINNTVKRTLNLLSAQMKGGKIKLVEKLDAADALVQADQEQLQIVFLNIILNAIQSIPDSGTLRVATAVKGEPKQSTSFAQVIVSDSGVGIPAKIFDSIFDPFVTSKEGGTGLGLSIANQIVHNHGGWIEALNNPDKGATFIVNLPIKDLKA
jgi:signal transduction histidine kinase